MMITKHVTINLGNYESLKLGVDDVDSYEQADMILLAELKRLEIPVSSKIRQVLKTQTSTKDRM